MGLRGDQGVGLVELFAGHEVRKGFEAIGVGIVTRGDGTRVPSISGDISAIGRSTATRRVTEIWESSEFGS